MSKDANTIKIVRQLVEVASWTRFIAMFTCGTHASC